jgi:uncharacterized caspase-like protein
MKNPKQKALYFCNISLVLCLFGSFLFKNEGSIIWQHTSQKRSENVCIMENTEGVRNPDYFRKGIFSVMGNSKEGKNDYPFLSIMDSLGNYTVKEKRIEGLENCHVNNGIQTQDGNYVIVGFKNITNEKMGWVAKIDHKGSILWFQIIDKTSENELKNVTESLIGELWLIGNVKNSLCLVKLDKNGKNQETFLWKKENSKLHGNGLAWRKTEATLVILGTEYEAKSKNLFITEFPTAQKNFKKERFKRIENAEGNAIVSNGLDDFGIIGNVYKNNRSNILVACYDVADDSIKWKQPFGNSNFDNKGLSITKDYYNNLIVAGESYEKDRDKKSQAFIHVLDKDGKDVLPQSLYLGNQQDNAIQSILISKQNHLIAVGSNNNKAWIAAIKVPFVRGISTEFCPIDTTRNALPKEPRITWINSKETSIDSIDVFQHHALLNVMVESTEPLCCKNILILSDSGKAVRDYCRPLKADNVLLDTVEGNKEYPFKYPLKFVETMTKNQGIVNLTIKTTTSTPLKLIKRKTPKLYVISVGINTYESESVSRLQFAIQDAKSIDSLFRTQEGFFERVITSLHVTQDSAKGDFIRKTIDNIAQKVDSNDFIILYLSGHGGIRKDLPNSPFVYIGSDYNKDNPKTYLTYDEHIRLPLEKTKAHSFVFIDACRDSVVYKSMISSGLDEKNEGLSKISIAKPVFRALFSCSDGQYSVEPEHLRHGAFTYAFLEAFRNKQEKIRQASLKSNNETPFLTFDELHQYLDKRVPQLTKQKPMYRGNSQRGDEDDIPIFMFQH